MGRNGKDKRDMFYRKAKEVGELSCGQNVGEQGQQPCTAACREHHLLFGSLTLLHYFRCHTLLVLLYAFIESEKIYRVAIYM